MKKRQIRFQSAGAAHNFEIGFVPTKVTVTNHTKWATDGTAVKFYWHTGDAAASALAEIADDTGINRSLITTNGITMYGDTSYPSNQSVISAITAASPPVVTVASTGGWETGDTVVLRDVTGMTEVNGKRYKITVINTTTFSLQDVDATGFSAYVSGGIAYNVSKNVTDSGFVGVTLGTSVVGANDDIMVLECEAADAVENLGDIA